LIAGAESVYPDPRHVLPERSVFRVLAGFIPVLLWCCIAVTPLCAQTLLYELYHPENSQPSYLFGTLHDRGLPMQLPDYQLAGRMEATQVLALEQVSEWPGEMLVDHALFHSDHKLYDVLKRGQYRRVCRFFWRNGGLEPDVLDDYQPAYLSVMAAQYQRREGVYLDWVLRDMAASRGMPVFGLESMTEQMAVLESLSWKEQGALLDAMVDRKRGPKLNAEAMVKAYLHAELDSLALWLHAWDHPAYRPDVIQGRNRLLAERVESLTSRYAAFIGVGAAHLAGEDNLLDRLRALGIQVIPVLPGAAYPPVKPAAEEVPEAEALQDIDLESGQPEPGLRSSP
jgi:hypothetical protein